MYALLDWLPSNNAQIDSYSIRSTNENQSINRGENNYPYL